MSKIFDYIVFNIIIIQKHRGISNNINKDNLEQIVNIIINNLYLEDEIKEALLEEFYIYTEIERFMNTYYDYFYIDESTLYLEDNISLEEIEKLANKTNLNKLMSNDILEMLEDNLKLKELYGITIRKDVYNYMYKLYKKIGELYNDTKRNLSTLKVLQLESNILSFNIENSMEIFDVYDLQLYSDKRINDSKKEKINFNIKNHQFIDESIEKDPFLLILLGKTNIEDEIINYKNDILFTRYIEPLYIEKLEDYSFYLKYYYLLIDEINNTKDINIKNKLIIAKNNLMKSIDIIFNNTLFMAKDNSDDLLRDFRSDYGKVSSISFFFIDEMLSYKDSDYLDDNIRYQNIIKKNYIKAYYEITKDELIEYAIKDNTFDTQKNITNNLLDEIITKHNQRRRENN